jgi:hypothetical protein
MKNAFGRVTFHIEIAAPQMNILMSKRRKVAISAFRAFPHKAERAKERDTAVLIQTSRSRMTGPGLMDTISKRKMAAKRRKTTAAIAADRTKSM